MVKREILTYPMTVAQLYSELEYWVEYFSDRGETECSAEFMFTWTDEPIPEEAWPTSMVPLDELVERVRKAGTFGFGEFGYNDLQLEIQAHKFLFCNDTDIHITFDQSTPTIEHFFARWRDLGFQPADWRKMADGKTVDKVR